MIPSLAPVVYNVMIVLGGLLLASRFGMTGFALGVLVGALLGNFLLQVYGAYSVGALFRPNLNLRHPGFILFLKLSVPIMLALSLVFTDDWIIRWFGSYLQPASITWLSYGKTLMRVPLGVVGQGVGVASFPFLAQLYSEGKIDELNRLLNSTMKWMIALLVPISALTIAAKFACSLSGVFAHAIARPGFRRHGGHARAFFPGHVRVGRAEHSGSRLLRHAQHTHARDRRHPAGLCESSRSTGCWCGAHQHLGLAFASSLGITVYTVVLFVLLNRRTHNREAGAIMVIFLKICGASAAVAWVCHRLQLFLEPHFAWHTIPGAFTLLVIVTSVGIALLLVAAKLLGIPEFDELIARAWKKVPTRKAESRSLGFSRDRLQSVRFWFCCRLT